MITFIVYRVLIKQILLKSKEIVSKRVTARIEHNFICLGNVLYYVVKEAIKGYRKEGIIDLDDKLRGKMYKEPQLKLVLTDNWVLDMKELFITWVNSAYEILKEV